MAINMNKGEKVSLGKGLEKAIAGLGWDIRKSTGAAYDLDFFWIEAGADGKAANGDASIMYYGHKENTNKSVYVGEDNLTGAGEGYDEHGYIEFTKVPANVTQILACVSIYQYRERGQNFGQVNNAIIDVLDGTTNAKLATYDLTEDMSNATGIVVGRFRRENDGSWSFKAVGEAFPDGMNGIIRSVGLSA